MRICLIGHGWIAEKMALALRGHDVSRFTHLNAFAVIDARLARAPFHWIVNCAGVTGTPTVDECETRKAETIEGNTVFPVKLSILAQKWGNRLAHFSSGCIFQGGVFGEDDPPNFDGSVYSASKLVSDQALKDHALVLRIRMPFDNTDNPKSLLTKLRKYALRGKILDGCNSLSDADEMCEKAAELINEKAQNGVYHLVNKGAIWTRDIMKMLDIECTFWDKEEFRFLFPAPRSECQLSTKLDTRPVGDALIDAIEKLRIAA